MNKKRVAVIFGGKSPEHEVSVITAHQVLENIDKEKYEALPIYIAKDGQWFTGEALLDMNTYKNLATLPSRSQKSLLAPDPTQKGLIADSSNKLSLFKKVQISEIDVFFVAFHGGLGESGGFQGLFDITEIPYVGNSTTGAVLSMDKVIMKQLFEQNELPITKWLWFYRSEWENNRKAVLENVGKSLTYPLFVKPSNGGSSIGVSKVKSEKELENAIEVAALFDRKIIVEEGFVGREINISVIGNSGGELITSVCEEVFHHDELLTYQDKYVGNSKTKSQGMASTKRQLPASLQEKTKKKIEELAKKAFSVVDNNGLARIDFMINEEKDTMVILEPNNPPGSMGYYLWEASGLSFKDMITKLITLAEERFEESKKNTTHFSSNILENFNPAAAGSKIPQ